VCAGDDGTAAPLFARSLQHAVDDAVLPPAAWSVGATFEAACVIGVLITFVVYHEYLLVLEHAKMWLIYERTTMQRDGR